MRRASRITILRYAIVVLGLMALASCSITPGGQRSPLIPKETYKVGKPYKVAGKIYRPQVQPDYDQVGLASWYGPNFHGKRTANGDVFNMNDLTAAHTTLPMPSYVRVTNLKNGRWLILKVNDRGPFVGNRLIDVSRRGAQLLGFMKQGVTRVRVQAVTGSDGQLPQQVRDIRPDVPKKRQIVERETLPEPQKNVTMPLEQGNGASDATFKVVEAEKDLYIQIGAYADRTNAEKVARDIGHIGKILIEAVMVHGQNLFRVRLGPEKSSTKIDSLLGRILARGHNTARIIRD